MRAQQRRASRPARAAHASAAAVRLWFEAHDLCLLELGRLTPAHVSARVDGPRLPRPGERGLLHVQLGARQLAPIAAAVRALNQATRWLELELPGVDLETGLALAGAACAAARTRAQVEQNQGHAHREELEDETARSAALRFLVESAAVGTVETPRGPCKLTALRFDASSQELVWQRTGPLPATPFLITVEGYNTLYRIPVRSCRAEGEQLCSARPPWIESVRSRRARRARAGDGVRIKFDHPLWPELRVERRLLDLTQRGLSFEASNARECVYPGLVIPRLMVETSDGDEIALRALVVSTRGGHAASFGCEVSPAGVEDAARWLKLCEQRLFPGTRRGAAEVWSVYHASGYFGLSDTLEGAFDHLRADYVNASRALSAAPELGCQASWPASGRPTATVTNLRLTPSCWFSYHLAARPDEAMSARSADVLRDLYRQYIEHCLATAGARWQMAYVQHSAHWSMRVHVDIPRRYAARGEALVQEFRALEVRTVGRVAAPASSPCARRAEPAEREQLLRRLQQTLPPIYFDALDYAPERFCMEAFRAQWARHGLERDRELLVASEAGEPLAAGVVECAQPGLHLFGLLDTLRMYALSPAGERAFPSLLELARGWFRERGRRSFCYLEEQGRLAPDGRLIKHMSPAFLTLLSVERLPEMLEHLYLDTARTGSR
jgi:hypothetical protein